MVGQPPPDNERQLAAAMTPMLTPDVLRAVHGEGARDAALHPWWLAEQRFSVDDTTGPAHAGAPGRAAPWPAGSGRR